MSDFPATMTREELSAIADLSEFAPEFRMTLAILTRSGAELAEGFADDQAFQAAVETVEFVRGQLRAMAGLADCAADRLRLA